MKRLRNYMIPLCLAFRNLPVRYGPVTCIEHSQTVDLAPLGLIRELNVVHYMALDLLRCFGWHRERLDERPDPGIRHYAA
jgi:hypothetical protein